MREITNILNTKAGIFIEIVNFNVRGSQYVCAGDLRALDCLQHILDGDMLEMAQMPEVLEAAILKQAQCYHGVAAYDITLHRGRATVPLQGVDVPFHSSQLQPMMEPFRTIMANILDKGGVKPTQLIGKYIPNLTGKPFGGYFEQVFERTGSHRVGQVLEQWDQYWVPRLNEERLTAVVS